MAFPALKVAKPRLRTVLATGNRFSGKLAANTSPAIRTDAKTIMMTFAVSRAVARTSRCFP
jgi:hypothetical protein